LQLHMTLGSLQASGGRPSCSLTCAQGCQQLTCLPLPPSWPAWPLPGSICCADGPAEGSSSPTPHSSFNRRLDRCGRLPALTKHSVKAARHSQQQRCVRMLSFTSITLICFAHLAHYDVASWPFLWLTYQTFIMSQYSFTYILHHIDRLCSSAFWFNSLSFAFHQPLAFRHYLSSNTKTIPMHKKGPMGSNTNSYCMLAVRKHHVQTVRNCIAGASRKARYQTHSLVSTQAGLLYRPCSS